MKKKNNNCRTKIKELKQYSSLNVGPNRPKSIRNLKTGKFWFRSQSLLRRYKRASEWYLLIWLDCGMSTQHLRYNHDLPPLANSTGTARGHQSCEIFNNANKKNKNRRDTKKTKQTDY